MKHRFIFVAASDLIAYISGAFLATQFQQQDSATTWERLITELGVPVALLLLVGWVIWKWGLPFIEKQTEYAQQQVERAQEQMREDSRAAMAERAKYLEHLGKISNQLEKVGDGTHTTAVKLDAINDAIREMKMRQEQTYLQELERLRKAALGGD